MIRKIWSCILVFATAIGIASCGSSSPGTSTVSATTITSNGTAITGALVSSVGGAGISPSGSNLMDDTASNDQSRYLDEILQPKPVNRSMTFTAYDSECSPTQSGWPVGSSGCYGNTLAWTGQFFYCLMREPSSGPDTVMGAFSQAMGFACAMGNNLTFDGAAHTVTMAITTACFPQAFVTQMTNNGISSITASVTASTTSFLTNTVGAAGWDGSMEMTTTITGQGTMDLVFLFANRNGVFTMAKSDGASATNSAGSAIPYQDAWLVSYDSTNGILRYEGRFQRYSNTQGSNGGWNRHIRTLVKGTPKTDGTGTFSAVSSVQALWSQVNKASSGGYLNDTGGIKSMSGSPAGGFYILNYEVPNNGTANPATMSTWTSDNLAGCMGKTGVTCTGNTGITFTSNTDALFAMPGTATSTQVATNKAWFNALTPPTYTSLTTADTQ